MDNASIEDLKKMIDNLNKTILNLANQLEEERKKNQPPAADIVFTNANRFAILDMDITTTIDEKGAAHPKPRALTLTGTGTKRPSIYNDDETA